jgi:hypothetical protein
MRLKMKSPTAPRTVVWVRVGLRVRVRVGLRVKLRVGARVKG